MRNSRHDRNTTHRDSDSQPTQLRSNQPLQPSLVTVWSKPNHQRVQAIRSPGCNE